MSRERLATTLAQHPRLMGVLFTALLVLSQVTTTVVAHGTTTNGP